MNYQIKLNEIYFNNIKLLVIGCANSNILVIYSLSDKSVCNKALKIELPKSSFFIYKGVNLKNKGNYKWI